MANCGAIIFYDTYRDYINNNTLNRIENFINNELDIPNSNEAEANLSLIMFIKNVYSEERSKFGDILTDEDIKNFKEKLIQRYSEEFERVGEIEIIEVLRMRVITEKNDPSETDKIIASYYNGNIILDDESFSEQFFIGDAQNGCRVSNMLSEFARETLDRDW